MKTYMNINPYMARIANRLRLIADGMSYWSRDFQKGDEYVVRKEGLGLCVYRTRNGNEMRLKCYTKGRLMYFQQWLEDANKHKVVVRFDRGAEQYEKAATMNTR